MTTPDLTATAADYLAAPHSRHEPPARVSADVLADLDALHARCAAGWAASFEPGPALVEVTAAGRITFVGGGSSTALLDADLVDAVVHAARNGYRLCLTRPPKPNYMGYRCWLPAGHDGDCEPRGWWRWSLLYGYRGPVTVVCTSCTPHRHVPVPDDCPHLTGDGTGAPR